MEIPNAVDASGREVCVAPAAYERYKLRRYFWTEMGLRYDDMTHRDVDDALTFAALERKHPQRERKAAA